MRVEGLVTTIIPAFERAEMTTEAVASVLAQDYRPIEIIVIDDGSSPACAQALLEIAQQDECVTVLRQDNGGPGAAREKGRAAARGAFIQYLDSDDILLPGKFSAQVKALHDDPSAGVAYGMTRFRQADGALVPGAWKGSGAKVESMFPSFLVSRWWDTCNPLYRRELCDLAGPWLQTRIEEDWEYDCRIASHGARLAFVPAFVCEVRDHTAPRLSRDGAEPARLRDRAKAHVCILQHARAAGVATFAAEMQHFARALFLLARQCGAAGLEAESAELFALSRSASGKTGGEGWDFRIYEAAVRLLGWRRVGQLAAQLDKLRA